MDTSNILSIVFGMFEMVTLLFCLIKMGADPWASVIPIYNVWTLCEYTWGRGIMLLTWLIPYVGIIFMLATYWKLFKGFGKSNIFCIFGIIFQPIAIAICAFDNSTYCG